MGLFPPRPWRALKRDLALDLLARISRGRWPAGEQDGIGGLDRVKIYCLAFVLAVVLSLHPALSWAAQYKKWFFSASLGGSY